MQTTVRNLTIQRVADPDRADAKAWVARRLAWEHRLRHLEAYRGATEVAAEHADAGGKVARAARGRVPFARAR